jgi:lipopolysaccharide/colanic/teichoic acid biosynthesis glycosyltransferase
MKGKILLIIVVDGVLIFLSFLLAFHLRFSDHILSFFISYYAAPTFALVFIYLLCLLSRGVYRERFRSNFELFEAVFKGSLLAVIVGMSFIFIFRSKWGGFPSSIFLISYFMIFLFIALTNMLLYKALGSVYRNICFIGEKELKNVENLVNQQAIDEIVLTTENIEIDKLYFLLNLARFKKSRISVLPEIYDKIIAKRVREEKREIYALPAYFKNKPEERVIRASDIILSFLLLFFAWPLLLFISLLIKVDSAGPVIYRQERIGRNGKRFTLYKLRSMFTDVPLYSRPKEVSLAEDSRVTRIGKIIRKSRLDEFPQLFNVLKGDMSLVGPRPEAIYRVKEHRALQGIRLSVKPGLTGLAQIHGYYHTAPNHKLRYDYLYIRNRSLRLNLNILIKTTTVMFLKPGS